jgi:4-alpha-glucanotransferase
MKNNKLLHTITDKRTAGILMHVTSLPGDYGIGDLGPSSRQFIDFLADAGQSFWQVLPLGPVSPVFGNSPYMSFSAFAGNPLMISPEILLKEGRMQPSDLPPGNFSEYSVDFDQVIVWKKQVLNTAWRSFQANGSGHTLDAFIDASPWVRDYGLFMALKKKFGEQAWFQWPRALRLREPDTLKAAEKELIHEIRYFQFEQFLFHSQWQKLHKYAHSKNIRIIGDLPIYVGLDSVDVWANQEIFELTAAGRPVNVAGVPPDYFSKNGQRWGNPLYRWNSRNHKIRKKLYDWWARRLENLFATVDVVRIDHFRGFESYWSVPAREKTAVNGSWKKGPGKKFFDAMEKKLGKLPIIAEDLGIITPAVEKLRDDLAYPGMKILLFAFDGNTDNGYLPYNYSKNCVVYTGTHDNDTAVGWYLSPDVPDEDKLRALYMANTGDREAGNFHKHMIYLAHSSTACMTILPMQDVLGFGNDCRMNTPGTTSGNWQWRCAPRFITGALAARLRQSTRLFGRLPERTNEKTTK